jgi:hypothetical protein
MATLKFALDQSIAKKDGLYLRKKGNEIFYWIIVYFNYN